MSVAELAGEASESRLDGIWWAAWQTFVRGEPVITSQPVEMQQLGQTVRMQAREAATEKPIEDYLWRGELRIWDGHILMGWYVATRDGIRDKGTMFFVMHTTGDHAAGRWVGNSYDGPMITGLAALARSREEVLSRIEALIHEGPTGDAVNGWTHAVRRGSRRGVHAPVDVVAVIGAREAARVGGPSGSQQ